MSSWMSKVKLVPLARDCRPRSADGLGGAAKERSLPNATKASAIRSQVHVNASDVSDLDDRAMLPKVTAGKFKPFPHNNLHIARSIA